jgi:hypothetical protein
MLTRRYVLCAAAALVIVAAPALAADASAQAFVTQIYDAYKGKDSKGRPLDSDRAIRRYFEPALAALMIKDQNAAAKRGEVGALDGDPFIDAQDWEIDAFDIKVVDLTPNKAQATVKFTNLGSARTVVLDLTKIKSDWRISDITWTRDGKRESLRALFVKK